MNAAHPHDKVALTVVRFLGAGAILGLAVTGYLVWRALSYEGDPATVALIGSVSSLASLFAGSLASILASTGKGAPQPVTVENPPADPVPVQVPVQQASAGRNTTVTFDGDETPDTSTL